MKNEKRNTAAIYLVGWDGGPPPPRLRWPFSNVRAQTEREKEHCSYLSSHVVINGLVPGARTDGGDLFTAISLNHQGGFLGNTRKRDDALDQGRPAVRGGAPHLSRRVLAQHAVGGSVDGLLLVVVRSAAGLLAPRCSSLLQSRSCLLYTSPSPRDLSTSRMPSSA